LTTTKISYDRDAALRTLESFGIPATTTNIQKALKLAPALDDFSYVDQQEFSVGARKLAAELAQKAHLKATQPIATAIDKVKVPRYDVKLENPTTLIFDPAAGMSPIGARAAAAPKSINVGHTAKGGVKITLGDEASPLRIEKGKWVKATLADIARGPKDLERLEKEGYNPHALRDLFIAKTDDGTQTYFALRDLRVDREDPTPGGPGVKAVSRPGFPAPFQLPDASRGLIAISDNCTEVHIIGFNEGKPLITIKKPVIYLYPEKKTNVRVRVEAKGAFIAQYPESKEGLWDLIATPDGMLFDASTEKKYGYIYWESEQRPDLVIDRSKAFCVRSTEVERFLEDASLKLGLNDRERTDFITFWLAPLKRNPVSLVQFLIGDECEAYAKMSIEPKPDSEIRVFMIFQRIPEVMKVGAPELPTLRRHRFTVVEWGGTNLDE
jgi:hypothetical protein